MTDNHKPPGHIYVLKRALCTEQMSSTYFLAEIISSGGISGRVEEGVYHTYWGRRASG